MINLAKNMQQNELYEGAITETQRDDLDAIVGNDRPLVAPIALALMKRDNPDYRYTEAVYDVTQSSARIANPETANTSDKGSEFKIYPNPAIDFTTLSYTTIEESLAYSIVDATGKTILSGELKAINNPNGSEVVIGLESLSPGIYQIRINSKEELLWAYPVY